MPDQLNTEDNTVVLPTREEMQSMLALAREMIAEERAEAELAGRPRYADSDRNRFPLYTADYALASKAMYDNAKDMHKTAYSAEQWENIGNVIAAAINFTSAKHNEEDDVSLVMQAMVLVRELVAREAIDGVPDSTYKLTQMVYCLSILADLKFNEEWDVILEEYDKTDASSDAAVAADESTEIITEGDEDMTISEEDLAKITEANAASNAALVEAFAKTSAEQTAALLEGLKGLVVAQTPAAPTKASADDEDETDDEVTADGDEPDAEAKSKKDDEEEDEDDKDKKKGNPFAKSEEVDAAIVTPKTPEGTPDDGLSPAERAGKAAEAAAALASEEEAAELERKNEEAENLAAAAAGGGSGSGLGTANFRLWSKDESEKYLGQMATASKRTIAGRIKNGQMAVAGENGEPMSHDDIVAGLSELFRR